MGQIIEEAIALCERSRSKRKATEEMRRLATRCNWSFLDREIREAKCPHHKRTVLTLMVMKTSKLALKPADERVWLQARLCGDKALASAENIALALINEIGKEPE